MVWQYNDGKEHKKIWVMVQYMGVIFEGEGKIMVDRLKQKEDKDEQGLRNAR